MATDTNAIRLELFLSDFVSDNTRRERAVLLVLCALATVVATTGLVPSKIDALGIEFKPSDQRSLLTIIAAILGYLATAFVVHGLSDYTKWRAIYGELIRSDVRSGVASQHQRISDQRTEIGAAIDALRENDRVRYEAELERKRQLIRAYIDAPRQPFANQIVWTRVVFDLLLPVVLAVITGVVLLVVGLPPSP